MIDELNVIRYKFTDLMGKEFINYLFNKIRHSIHLLTHLTLFTHFVSGELDFFIGITAV